MKRRIICIAELVLSILMSIWLSFWVANQDEAMIWMGIGAVLCIIFVVVLTIADSVEE